MKETQPESLYASRSIRGKVFRLLGSVALSDYERDCVIQSRKEIQHLGEGLGYPFNGYSICRAFINLGFQLKDNLKDIDTILCEGVGAVLMSQVFWKLAERARSAESTKNTDIFYLASGQRSKAYPAIEEFLSEQRSNLGKELVCTDFTFTWKSLVNITSILDRIGVDYRVAILEDSTLGNVRKRLVNKNISIGIYHTTQIRPGTESINIPALNGFHRDRRQTTALLIRYDGGPITRKAQEDLIIFTQSLANIIGV